MNIVIVLEQMCVMLLLILAGCLLFRKGRLNEVSSRHISGLVVNLCNPAVLVCSAFESGPRLSGGQLFHAFLVTLSLYALLLAAGFLFPLLLRVPKKDAFFYRQLTVYGNVGFLGIPLVSAVLGSQALIYVSLNCLIFNILFYTMDFSLIRKRASLRPRLAGEGERKDSGASLRPLSRLVNPGTVSALLTLLFYLGGFPVPSLIRDAFTYTGRATTFLSMIVLGISVAQMPLREIFCHKKDYLFVLLRMLLLPAGCVFLLRAFVSDPLLLSSSVLLLSVPCANLPLMCARENGLEDGPLARIIVLTTLLSAVTIPAVALLV